MNRLPFAKRAQVLHMLVEGSSMRSTARVCGVSFNAVARLLVDAGHAAVAYHDQHVRNLQSRRIECDEIWSFCYAKQANVADAKAAPEGSGDVWTWTALDSDSKLIVTWLVGERDARAGLHFMEDLKSRLANRVQLTTDGWRPYPEAVEAAFGADIDYAQLVKMFGTREAVDLDPIRRYSPVRVTAASGRPIIGRPDMDLVSTSYVERHNLTTRMQVRRFTRLTNAFSKKQENHGHMLALYFLWYNYCWVHGTLKTTPAMAAGLAEYPYGIDWIVRLIEEQYPPLAPRGPYRPRANSTN